MDVLVVDDEGKNLGFSSIGEIAVRSEFLFECYWKQPALTDAVFILDPDGRGCRTFRTGDRGRIRLDGCLEYVGRKDSQLKIRGHTIQPEEVEIALLRIAAIAQAVVVGSPDEHGEVRLIAYVVPHQNQTITVTSIRDRLRQQLSEYMIPSAFVVLSALPLKANGKVAREALPPPSTARPLLRDAYVEPRTAVETVIVRLWSDALALSELGIKDNFFDLGGDSILASKIIATMSKIFPGGVSVPEFFESATVERISQVLTAKEPSTGQTELAARAFLAVENMSADEISRRVVEERSRRHHVMK
jgi:hypothetical protein